VENPSVILIPLLVKRRIKAA